LPVFYKTAFRKALTEFALKFFGECFDYFLAVLRPLFAVSFFFDNPFPYKPVGFYHCGVNGGVDFVSGGDDDLFYFGDVGIFGVRHLTSLLILQL